MTNEIMNTYFSDEMTKYKYMLKKIQTSLDVIQFDSSEEKNLLIDLLNSKINYLQKSHDYVVSQLYIK